MSLMFNHFSDNIVVVASTPTGKGIPMPNICVTPITDQMENRLVKIKSYGKEIFRYSALFVHHTLYVYHCISIKL